MSKSKTPRWILNQYWAIDTDPYCWILYKRVRQKNGSLGIWKSTSYHPNAGQLFESLLQTITRLESEDKALIAHLEACYERTEGLAARFSELIKAEGVFQVKNPSIRKEAA